MNPTIESDGGSVEVSTYTSREMQVVLDAEDGHSSVALFLTPGQAVELSRALMAAAAEALGVKV